MRSATLREAFLASSYGCAGARGQLCVTGPASRPAWSAPGQPWAILTAWNPQAQRVPAGQNAQAQAALHREVACWSPLPGWNAEGPWREDTLIVRGTPLQEAVRLGYAYGQVAVVWGVGRRAALVWLDGPAAQIERFWWRPLPDAAGYTARL
ncbi:DUF3293 domain-containing protein [Deinococcus taeanensis]|uniref:DUF3293 domain-containing protein n=1 Tax=Deinococcus taeanensis TaxID=2737050 RepID=UPI001CDCA655|nr:DUF3293 domain-containing protein [Deinococcus taeanensis]UBV41487.1 DUF3293 domain-containing protein [Deinococcus taeanensis]